MSADTAIYIVVGDKARAVRGCREGLSVCAQGSPAITPTLPKHSYQAYLSTLNADTSFICLLIEDPKNVDGSSVK